MVIEQRQSQKRRKDYDDISTIENAYKLFEDGKDYMNDSNNTYKYHEKYTNVKNRSNSVAEYFDVDSQHANHYYLNDLSYEYKNLS